AGPELAREDLVHDGDGRRLRGVMPGDVATAEEAGAGGVEIAGRHGEYVGREDRVGSLELRGARRVDGNAVEAAGHRRAIDEADGRYAGDGAGGLDDRFPLGEQDVRGGVRLAQVDFGKNGAAWLEAEGNLKGAHHTAHGHERSSDEQR